MIRLDLDKCCYGCPYADLMEYRLNTSRGKETLIECANSNYKDCKRRLNSTEKGKEREITLKRGMKFKHFKGGLYIVLCVAHHSETGEKLVVYFRENDGSEHSGHICARPMDMFLSKVDRNKYPDAEQEYRFEEVKEDD